MSYEVQIVVDEKAALAEGPAWDARTDTLYWIDIPGMNLHMYNTVSNSNRTIHIGQPIGAVVPSEKQGELIMALQHGFYSFDIATEALTPIIDPESDKPNNRFNDGKCDAAGRFWAGTMSLQGEDNQGSLYRLDNDRNVSKLFSGASISNGLIWSPDLKTMYYIDSPTKKVDAFDYNHQTGELSNKRTAIDMKDLDGTPDGMTIDAEGMLWVAHWGGHQVTRWNPETAELIDSVPMPAANVTSCCFGGENLDELYITTARIGLDEKALSEQPSAGGLFKVQTKVKGSPTHYYKG